MIGYMTAVASTLHKKGVWKSGLAFKGMFPLELTIFTSIMNIIRVIKYLLSSKQQKVVFTTYSKL